MLLHDCLNPGRVSFLFSYDLGEQPLPFRRRGPQPVLVGAGLGGAGGISHTLVLDVLLHPLHDPVDHERVVFAHPYLPVCFSTVPEAMLTAH